MTQTSKPSKEQVREVMAKNWQDCKPLTREQVRDQLGWAMLKDEREAQRPR